MEYYQSLLVKILEKSLVARDDKVVEKLKKNIDLSQKERRHLEELLDNI